MEVRKESNGLKNSMVTREELAIINRFTKRALKEDEVYTFAESCSPMRRAETMRDLIWRALSA